MSFKKVLITDSRIADITKEIVYGVEAGPAQSTYQNYVATSQGNSSVTYNIQLPSQEILVDRHVLIQNLMSFTLNITNVPIGSSAFSYGSTDSPQAFPFMKSLTTISANINNTNVTTNIQDVLDVILKMNDKRELNRLNSWCPSYPDSQIGEYTYVNGANTFSIVGANCNPMGSASNNALDNDFAPRGSFPAQFIQIDHFIANVYTDSSPISTATTDTWKVSIQLYTTEPIGLALAPFINSKPFECAGMFGLTNLTFTMNIDSTLKRIWSTSNYAVAGGVKTPYITSITPGINPQGGTAQSQFISQSQMIFNLLSLQPSQSAKIGISQQIPYLEYPRYLSGNSQYQSLTAGQTATLTANNYQLNQIPDKIIIAVRKQMSVQDWSDTASFLTINSISLNFNNNAGLMSSAVPQHLYEASVKQGLNASWNEFSGGLFQNNNTTGVAYKVPSVGSILVLNPVESFNLPGDYLSCGSLGQFNLQFNINVTNQFSYTIPIEILIVTVNSGIMTIQQGQTSVVTGILTKEDVMDANDHGKDFGIDKNSYERLVGGKMINRPLTGLRKIAKHLGKVASHSVEDVGGVMSAGSMSGAGHHHHHKSTRGLHKYM